MNPHRPSGSAPLSTHHSCSFTRSHLVGGFAGPHPPAPLPAHGPWPLLCVRGAHPWASWPWLLVIGQMGAPAGALSMGGERPGHSSCGSLCWFTSFAVAACLHGDSLYQAAPPWLCPSLGSGNNLPSSVSLALGGLLMPQYPPCFLSWPPSSVSIPVTKSLNWNPWGQYCHLPGPCLTQ